MTDTGEGVFNLFYLRSKEKKEIDFLIGRDNVPYLPIEVKLADEEISSAWNAFLKKLPVNRAIQVVKNKNVFRKHKIKFNGMAKEILVISGAEFFHYLV